MEFLRVVTRILRNYDILDIQLRDIDVNITRNKTDNMLVKAQALQILQDCGVDDEIALGIVSLFSDPQRVYSKSKERMQKRFDAKSTPKTGVTGNGEQSQNKEIATGRSAVRESGV